MLWWFGSYMPHNFPQTGPIPTEIGQLTALVGGNLWIDNNELVSAHTNCAPTHMLSFPCLAHLTRTNDATDLILC